VIAIPKIKKLFEIFDGVVV